MWRTVKWFSVSRRESPVRGCSLPQLYDQTWPRLVRLVRALDEGFRERRHEPFPTFPLQMPPLMMLPPVRSYLC